MREGEFYASQVARELGLDPARVSASAIERRFGIRPVRVVMVACGHRRTFWAQADVRRVAASLERRRAERDALIAPAADPR